MSERDVCPYGGQLYEHNPDPEAADWRPTTNFDRAERQDCSLMGGPMCVAVCDDEEATCVLRKVATQRDRLRAALEKILCDGPAALRVMENPLAIASGDPDACDYVLAMCNEARTALKEAGDAVRASAEKASE